MATYIGTLQINDNGEIMPIGSTLFGSCNTANNVAQKIVTLNDFNSYMNGVTVHVKFINGNIVKTGATLQVGSTSVAQIVGDFLCNPGEVVAFTLNQEVQEANGNTVTSWRVNRTNANIEITNNIITTIDGQTVNAATQAYVDSKTQGLDGITSPMDFKGVVTELPSGDLTAYHSGDVILVSTTNKEYVYDGNSWIELGDETSYVLKTSQSTGSAIAAATLNTNGLPSLSTENITASQVEVGDNGTDTAALITENHTIQNVSNIHNSITSAEVTNGKLILRFGAPVELGEAQQVKTVDEFTAQKILITPVTFKAVDTFNEGSQASLNTSPITVVTPVTTQAT